MTTFATLGLIAITALSAFAVFRLHRHPVLAVWAGALAVAGWAVHLYVYGHYLLLAPLYLYLALSSLLLRALYRRPRFALAPRLLGFLGVVSVLLTTVVVLLTSQPPLPGLVGDYPVGVASVRLEGRVPVSLPVRYPADIPGAYAPSPNRAGLLDSDPGIQSIAASLELPPLYLRLFAPRRGYGFRGVALSSRRDRYPVVLLLPPNGWQSESFFGLSAQLASRGSIVFSADTKSMSASQLVESIRAGVRDQVFADRIDYDRMSVLVVGGGPTGESLPPIGGVPTASYGLGTGEIERLTDLDVLTRFPRLLGLRDNSPVREALLSVLLGQSGAAY